MAAWYKTTKGFSFNEKSDSPVFFEMTVATGVLTSNSRGIWGAPFAEGVVVPWLGRDDWMP